MANAVAKKRSVYFDILRIIAIIMVLFNHRETYEVANSLPDTITGIYFFQALLAMLCKCGPPLFFMISGALILGKQESFKYIFKHRIVRILIVMLACAIIVSVRDQNLTIPYIIGSFTTRLNWYLYSYLGYLFMLPFLRIIAINSSKKDAILFLCFICLFYIGDTILIFTQTGFFLFDSVPIYNVFWASSCWSIIFPMTGYFLIKKRIHISKSIGILLFLASILCLISGVILVIIDIKIHKDPNAEMIRQHMIFVPCCGIFIGFANIDNKLQKLLSTSMKKVIMIISGATFGMFVLETHSTMSNSINGYLLANISGSKYLTAIISIILEFILYFAITSVLKLIPGVKKVL